MRMVVVVVVDPGRELLQHRENVRPRLYACTLALEGLDEGFAGTVAFRAPDRGKAGQEGEGGNKLEGLASGLSGPVIRGALHGTGCPQGIEPSLDAGEHQNAHHLAADAAGAGLPGDDLAVTGVDGEGDPHDFAVRAADLQPVRGPALVGRRSYDLPFMRTNRPQADIRLQQKVGLRHQAKDALVVDGLCTGRPSRLVQQRGDAPVALG